MKILIFSEYYYPERFLIHEIAEKLVEAGHQVCVVTGKPNYGFPDGKVPAAYRDVDHETIHGVEVYRCNVFGRRKDVLSLILNYLSYVKNGWAVAKKLGADFDVVLCYQLTPVLQLIPAVKYSRKHHKKLVCYCLDLAPLSGEKRAKKIPVFFALYKGLARKLYRSCDYIGVTSKPFIEYLTRVHDISPEKVQYIPQHGPSVLLKSDLRKQYTGEIKILFAGNMGNGPRLETIIHAVDILRDRGVNGFGVVFVGEGSAKERLKQLVDSKDLGAYVTFLPSVPMDQMAPVYADADALIVTLRKGQITIPGKLQAYMYTGKPIIGAMDGAGRELIEEADCGICAEAENSADLADAMEQYILHHDEYVQKGENGRRFFADHFTLEIFNTALEALLVRAYTGETE